MKKILVSITLIVIMSLCACTLCACGGKDNMYAVAENVEIASITMNISDYYQTYSFEGAELDELTAILKAQNTMEKDEFSLDIITYSVLNPIYTLSITTKKKFLKKAKTYTLTVGEENIIKRQVDDTVVNTYTSDTIMRRSNYGGSATSDLVEFLQNAEAAQNLFYSAKYYNAVKVQYTTDGYVITNKSQDGLGQFPTHGIEGFSAVKDAGTSTEANLTVFRFDTEEHAKDYHSRYGGNYVKAIWAGGSVGSAQMAITVLSRQLKDL